MSNDLKTAPGAPGSEPRWSASNKQALGTAHHSGCRAWFTLGDGVLNEIYYPHVDCPDTRDLQLLVTDGETFCHEERHDLDHQLEYPEKGVLLCRLTNSERGGSYRLIKEVFTDPHASTVFMHVRLMVDNPGLQGKLRVFAVLAAHVKGQGGDNFAQTCEVDGRPLLHAWREDIHLAFGASPDFLRRSVGYVGASDGWQDLMHGFQMDWQYEEAGPGNLALTAELDFSHGNECLLAVSFGANERTAATKLLHSLAWPLAQHREYFVAEWQAAQKGSDDGKLAGELAAQSGDDGHVARVSRAVLLAHEDKEFPGAFVASLSTPWGAAHGDKDVSGYHLAWPRDLVQCATGLLAAGDTDTPLRALVWLACVQEDDGGMPQNSWIDGRPYWRGVQLDEVALPVLLAWRLRAAKALACYDPWHLVCRAARYLILHGPVTGQERWESIAGYSPSTLAANIAALVCAADFAREKLGQPAADFLLAHADWLRAHLADWTVTNQGELVPGKTRHFVRINPAAFDHSGDAPDVDTATVRLGNGSGRHPARRIVDGGFLELVRLGILPADDPLVLDSVAVIDAVLKCDFEHGPSWHRFNHDGYGQKRDGSPFTGEGEGGCWPVLTGERGHYELAAGRDPAAMLRAMESFANMGGLLTEQLWPFDDLPSAGMRRGQPTGAAMPLAWAHAEYLSLLRSQRDHAPFPRLAPVFERYASRQNPPDSFPEVWTVAHPVSRLDHGKPLRLVFDAPTTVHWSKDASWTDPQDVDAQDTGLGCWFVDLPTERQPTGSSLAWTFRHGESWAGKNYEARING